MSNRPMPTITTINRPFWEGCDAQQLKLQRCDHASCREFVYFPRVCCPHCGGGNLTWQLASGRGKIETFTKVHRPQHDSFKDDLPIYFIAVRLQEGPLLFSRLIVKPNTDEGLLGHPVTVCFSEPIGGHRLPYFSLTHS